MSHESCHLGFTVMILSAAMKLASGRCPFTREGIHSRIGGDEGVHYATDASGKDFDAAGDGLHFVDVYGASLKE